MTARKRGGVQAANHVVHIPWDKTTVCGRPRADVNCYPDDDATERAREEQCCRRCARGVLSSRSGYNAFKARPA